MLSNKQQYPREWLIDLVVLATIFTLFYFFKLGHYPLFTPDEGRYSEVAREMVVSGDYITPRLNGVTFLDKPALYYWLQAIAIHLFGVQEWALRLFPAGFGIIGCLATYVFGRRFYSRRTALLASMISATTPLYFASAHYANLDLEVSIWITLTLMFLLAGLYATRFSKSILLCAYLCAGFATLTKGLIGIALPTIIIGSWIVVMQRWSAIKQLFSLTGIILFLGIILPWFILVQRANPEFFHYFFITQQVTRFLSAAEFNNQTAFWFYLPVIILGFFPWSIFLLQAFAINIKEAWQNPAKKPVTLYLVLWFAVILIFFSIPRSKIMTYILPAFPPLTLLTANYLDQAWASTKRAGIYGAAVLFFVLSAIIISGSYAIWQYNLLDLPPAFMTYLFAANCLLILSALLMLLILRRQNLIYFYSICLFCSGSLLIVLILSAPHINPNSAKSLVQQLKTVIQPQDEVILYYKYYQDIPIYLARQVAVANDWNSPRIIKTDNWARELWFGKQFKTSHGWLIDENEFWQRWQSKKRVYTFLNKNYFEQFKARAQTYFYLGKTNDIMLLSNQPLPSEKPTTYLK